MTHSDLTWIVPGVCAIAWLIMQLYTNLKVGETNSLIKEHIAADKGKHEAIDLHLEFTDKRVDRLEAHNERG